VRDTFDRVRQRMVPPAVSTVAALAIVNGTTKTSDTSGISRNYAIVIVMLGLLALAAAAIALFNHEVSRRIPQRWLARR